MGDNEIEIVVSSKDQTGPGFASVAGRARDARGRFVALGTEAEGVGRKVAGVAAGMVSSFGNVGASITASGGPYAALGLLGALLASLPMLANAAGAAITLGLGGALAGIGIAIAAQDQQVKDAFASLKQHVLGELKGWATPFEGTLIHLAEKAKSTFDALGPAIKESFAALAPITELFGKQFLGALGEKLPSLIRTATDSFGPLIGLLGRRMPDVIGSVTGALEDMMRNVDPRAFDLFISGITGTITVVGKLVAALEALAGDVAFIWDNLIAQKIDTSKWEEFAGIISGAGGAVAQAGQQAFAAADGLDRLADSLQRVQDQALSQFDAQIALDQAINNATATIRRNGRAFDGHGEKAAENRAALSRVAHAARQVAEAGGNTTASLNRARAAFIRNAMAAGLTRREAGRAADSLGLVRQKADQIKDKRMRVTANVAQALAALDAVISRANQAVAAAIAASMGGGGFGGFWAHGGIIGAAGGGPRSNLVMVGEQGAELVKLPSGSTVYPHGQSMQMAGQMAAQGGGGGDVIVRLVVDGKELAEVVFDPLKRKIRKRSGRGPDSVQTALGGG